MENLTNPKRCDMIVSEKECSLVELIRKTKFGQIIIYMENGQPIRIEKIKESIKL